MLLPLNRYGVLTCALLAGTFGAEVLLPPGYASWAPYLLAVMVARYWGGGRAVLVVTALAAGLTLVDLLASGPAGYPPEAVINRCFGVILIFLAGAITCVQALTAAALAREVAERRHAETALRESEDRFRAFMDRNPAVAWMKDEAGHYVYVNGTYLKRWGTRMKDWLGKTDHDLWPRATADCFRANDLAVLQGREAVEVVEPVPDDGGRQRDWWVLKFPFQDAAGRRYVGGVALDISDRVRAEESKNELIAQLRRAVDEIKTLCGLIPICSYCKRIRDDEGFWQQLEKYLSVHTEAQFTHGICPDCLSDQLGPEHPARR